MTLPSSHENLVKTLTKDLEPKKAINLKMFFLVWTIPSLIMTFVVIYFLGYQKNLLSQFTDPKFLLSSIALFVGALISAWFALTLSIPGREPVKNFRYILIGLPLVMATVLYIEWISLGHFDNTFFVELKRGQSCAGATFVLALIPLIGLTILSSKMAPLRPFITAIFISLSSLFLAGLGIQLHCSNTVGCHLATWHYLPIFFGSLLIAYPTQWFLSQWKSKNIN